MRTFVRVSRAAANKIQGVPAEKFVKIRCDLASERTLYNVESRETAGFSAIMSSFFHLACACPWCPNQPAGRVSVRGRGLLRSRLEEIGCPERGLPMPPGSPAPAAYPVLFLNRSAPPTADPVLPLSAPQQRDAPADEHSVAVPFCAVQIRRLILI